MERPDLDDRAYDLQERRILGGLLARPRIFMRDARFARENLKCTASNDLLDQQAQAAANLAR